MKKYKLIKSDISNLYHIEALRSFSNVKKGDIGGYVEGEHNLSHKGHCWIYDDACVYGNARVYGHACVWGNVRVYDDIVNYINNHDVSFKQPMLIQGNFVNINTII